MNELKLWFSKKTWCGWRRQKPLTEVIQLWQPMASLRFCQPHLGFVLLFCQQSRIAPQGSERLGCCHLTRHNKDDTLWCLNTSCRASGKVGNRLSVENERSIRSKPQCLIITRFPREIPLNSKSQGGEMHNRRRKESPVISFLLPLSIYTLGNHGVSACVMSAYSKLIIPPDVTKTSLRRQSCGTWSLIRLEETVQGVCGWGL